MSRPPDPPAPPGQPDLPGPQHADEQGNATRMGDLPPAQRAQLVRESRSWQPGERQQARAEADVELHGRGHVMRGEPRGEGPAGAS